MENKIPEYYIGKTHKYEARKVIEDFQPENYNVSTAITYLLRAGKKPGNPKRTRKEIREAIKKIKIKRELKQ